MTSTTYLMHMGAHYTDNSGVPRTVNNGLFNRFISEEVLPRFQSFTIMHADGFWQGKGEPIRVVSITTADQDEAAQIHGIAKRYCERFNQEAVFINALTSVANLIQ